MKNHKKSERIKKYKVCWHCDKNFEITKPIIGKPFCSEKCRKAFNSGFNKTCPICGKKFYVIKSRKNVFCCSKKCTKKMQSKNSSSSLNSGENHHCYNPNLTDEDRADRRLIPGYNEWVNNVKFQDNYTCQICGSKHKVVSHHIESYNNNPDLRLNLDNGITLCKKCHTEFHSRYGRGNNTSKQLIRFINTY